MLFGHSTALAGFTKIKGQVPAYPGQAVFLLRPADYVSWDRLPVAVTFTDEKGKFEFNYAHPDTVEVLVYTPRQQWPLVLVPGASYHCLFQMMVPEPYFRGDPPSLNAELEDLQTVLRTLDASLVGYRPGAEKYGDLYQELLKVKARYAKHPMSWVRTQAKYAIGYNLIDAASHLREFDRMDSLEMNLLFGQAVQLQHPEYIRFLYFTVLNRLSVPTFRHYLRDPQKDYGLPMDIIKEEIRWYPVALRPLVLLMAFKVCYMNNWYQTQEGHAQDLRALKSAIGEDQTAWQQISGALLHRFELLRRPFPGDIRLCDVDGKALNLKAHLGQWVLIRVRMGICNPQVWTVVQGAEDWKSQMKVVQVYANSSGVAFAPCDAAAFQSLVDWLGDACAADVLLDPTGRLVRW